MGRTFLPELNEGTLAVGPGVVLGGLPAATALSLVVLSAAYLLWGESSS